MALINGIASAPIAFIGVPDNSTIKLLFIERHMFTKRSVRNDFISFRLCDSSKITVQRSFDNLFANSTALSSDS